ncbi:restriction endonuclease subunit S [Klebsiella aerogenes]|uniref:restriction endonuclease subunit S n=1 Tax=Klebsiella aerogenes TaxID=548 RepID=UPI00036E8DC5|nr:restriction endonuclease subunit S [Klebsiella aerogenes]
MSKICLPQGWCTSKISDISLKGEQRKPSEDESFIYVDIGSINRDLKCIESPQKLIGKDAPSRARKVISAGDILVSLTRPNLNAVAMVPFELENQIATTGFEVIKPILVDSRYIFALTRSKDFIDSISGAVQGALYPAAKSSDVQDYTFLLPPLAEQNIIADKLDVLLSQVETTKKRLRRIPDLLKRFRQSVLTYAVSGRLTSETPAEEILKNTIKFEDILKDKKHLSYGVLKPGDFDPNGVPMLRVMDIGEWGQFNDTDVFKISKNLSREFKRTIVEVGDIVLSVMATIGRPAIIPPKFDGANVNRALAVIKLKNDIVPEYIQLQLLSPNFQSAFVDKQIGSAQKRINLSDLRQFNIWVPNINIQKEIVRRVEELFAFADSIEQRSKSALDRVNNLSQSILSKALRGDLTAEWRATNKEFISGDNSAKALLEKIEVEREAIKRQSKLERPAVKKKVSYMSEQIIKVVEALKQSGEPLSGQQLLAAAGYPSDSSTEQLEQFFLDIREALTIEKSIVRLKRDDDGQDWFDLAKIATSD